MKVKDSSLKSGGFTLVELMVVLLLIGIVVSLVFPRMVLPEKLNDISSHHRQIQNLVRLTREESITRGRILGIFTERNVIQVKRLLKGEWIDYAPSAALRQYRLKAPFSVEVRSDQFPFKIPSTGHPPIVLLPDGQTTPFELVIINHESKARLVIDSKEIAAR